jgi:hypothetical protein
MAKELDALAQAVQDFVNATEDHPSLVVGAALVYEVTQFEDNGDQTYKITYTIPSEQTSMAAAIGLLDAGHDMVKSDALDGDDED